MNFRPFYYDDRRWNPMLALDREAFIAALVDVPPKPAAMERILAANRGGSQLETHA